MCNSKVNGQVNHQAVQAASQVRFYSINSFMKTQNLQEVAGGLFN